MASFTFEVEGQHLRETEHRIVVSGSVRYLSADFHFSDDWGDIPKFAFFQKGTVTHKILLIDDKILPEQEIYLTDGTWLVSVLGDDVDGETINKRITTNEVYIHVDINGPTEGEPFEEITPSIGEQIIGEALKHATDAESAAEEAKRSEDSAKLYRNEAEQSENQAETSAKTAALEAQKSYDSAEKAKQVEESLPEKIGEYVAEHKDELKGDPGYTPVKGVDYFDGEPGYTPIKGVDYFDGEPGEPGKEYDDTELREEITSQNENIAKLDGEVSELNDGLAKLEEEKVGFEDWATDGLEKGGIAKVNAAYGISASASSHVLYVNPASNNTIDNRNSQYRPITPNTLDYAVKAAMTDGKGAEWTEAEQLSARQRIGLDKEWTLVGTWTNPLETYTLDLTGYTELALKSYIVATTAGAIRATIAGALVSLSNVIPNGTRYCFCHFKDSGMGIETCTAQYSTSSFAAMNGQITPFATIGSRISSISRFDIASTVKTAVTEMSIEIYAR